MKATTLCCLCALALFVLAGCSSSDPKSTGADGGSGSGAASGAGASGGSAGSSAGAAGSAAGTGVSTAAVGGGAAGTSAGTTAGSGAAGVSAGSGAAGSGMSGSGMSGSGSAGSGQSCPPECLRPYTCVASCGGTPFNNGCCPCPDGTVDSASCPASAGTCTPGCSGAAPEQSVKQACAAITTEASCSSFQTGGVPSSCRWVAASTPKCPLLP